jgi:hypothetical protein
VLVELVELENVISAIADFIDASNLPEHLQKPRRRFAAGVLLRAARAPLSSLRSRAWNRQIWLHLGHDPIAE